MREGIIFVEKDFWNKITSARERYVLLDKLIRSQSAVYTNFKKDEDTVLDLIYSETGGRLYWNKNINDFIDKDDIVSLTSIYLTDLDSLLCDGKSIQRGTVIFNNSLFSRDKKVFNKPDPIAIDEDKKYIYGWKNELFAPILSNNKCNSIIINDKYLCNKGYMNPDLRNLLEVVLPQKSNIPFHLSIFSQVNNNGNKIFQEIKRTIASVRSPEFCNNTLLTLCYTTDHDRYILSNTFYITIGSGFSLFNGGNKPSHSSSLAMYYPTAVGGKTEFYLRIKKANEINKMAKDCWPENGDRENRLFDLVK